MKEIHIRLGHSSKNPEQHCFDGDSSYVTGSAENTLVRLIGILQISLTWPYLFKYATFLRYLVLAYIRIGTY